MLTKPNIVKAGQLSVWYTEVRPARSRISWLAGRFADYDVRRRRTPPRDGVQPQMRDLPSFRPALLWHDSTAAYWDLHQDGHTYCL